MKEALTMPVSVHASLHEPEDLFDPVLYGTATGTTQSLPRWCYTSRVFLEREIETIFLPHWQFIGREDEVVTPGDYLVRDTVGGPVILLRGRDEQLRVFANTCRHRGAALLAGGGNCRAIVCPYHRWTYGLDGQLANAPHMDGVEDFAPADHGLIPVRHEVWDGFVFATYAEDGPDLMTHLGDFPAKFASHKLGDMVTVGHDSYDVRCNWKLLLENALEDYHTASVHGTSIGTQQSFPEAVAGECEIVCVPSDRALGVLLDQATDFPHIPGLTEEAAQRSYFTLVYPNTQFCMTQDSAWWLTVLPTGPDSCRLDMGYCFPKQTLARSDFESQAPKYIERWRLTAKEDIEILEVQQKGLASIVRRAGPLSWKEDTVASFDRWVLDRVLHN
jgi:phenylpropionate dioxygenase-like ring-hydroxylating dioxygenase large terminal subunit